MMQRAKQGKITYLRELPAVRAIPDAIRRATEMGRPVYFAPGSHPLTHGTYGGATMAGLTILRYVSRLCAEQQTRLEVHITQSDALPVANEAVRLGCIEAGHPEEELRQTVTFTGTGNNLLPFSAAQIRDEAGASMMFGDAGATTMVVLSSAAYAKIFQIIGNTEDSNCCWLPPMCDYFVMCDGPQAAAAYVSEDPEIMNTVLGFDIQKIVVIGIMVIGLILQTLFGLPIQEILMG
jgi:hypothetical protein